jgi:hypothetical protein
MMDLNTFLRGDKAGQVTLPEWFKLDHDFRKFKLDLPKNEKINFSILEYEGCLPIFASKVAGVMSEGRDDAIRKAKSIISKGNRAKAQIRLEIDETNIHHMNAIRIILSIKSGKDRLMQERCVGFVPAKLANFIRYANHHGVYYKCENVGIKTSKSWVSIGMKLVPDLNEPDEEIAKPIRTPMVKKTITGTTVNDFRSALMKKAKRRNK